MNQVLKSQYFFLKFLSESSSFTMLCYFLLYSKVNQPYICIDPLFFGFPSHLKVSPSPFHLSHPWLRSNSIYNTFILSECTFVSCLHFQRIPLAFKVKHTKHFHINVFNNQTQRNFYFYVSQTGMTASQLYISILIIVGKYRFGGVNGGGQKVSTLHKFV